MNWQVYVAMLGFVVSFMFCYIGFHCGSEHQRVLFSLTCVGYVSGNLGGHLSIKGGRARWHWFNLAMTSNSLASSVVSQAWCLGFGEWGLLMTLESVFQLCGGVFMAGNLVLRPVATLCLSVISYLVRAPSEVKSPWLSQVWIVVGATLILLLPIGMSCVGHVNLEPLRRRVQTLYEVLNAPETDFNEDADGEDLLKRFPTVGKEGHISGVVQVTGSRCVPFPDIDLQKRVGEGSFGVVWRGDVVSKTGDVTGQVVAVKIIEWQSTSRSAMKTSPLHEAKLAHTLSHGNLVRTYKYGACVSTRPEGECSDDEGEDDSCMELLSDEEVKEATEARRSLTIWIVLEWCDRGSLASFCTEPRISKDDHQEVCQILSDIASAGAYLHSKGVIHGDLTGNNVMLKSDRCRRGYICKLCDFGLARVLEGSTSAVFTTTMGAVSHMPPELFKVDDEEIKLSRKADVYASGILLWQVVMGQQPFSGMAAPQIILFVARGSRPRLAQEVHQSFRTLYDKCVAQDLYERPTFEEFCRAVESQGPP